MTEQKLLLTQLEAAYVLQEAYRLKASQIAASGTKHARLGQCIHWAAQIEESPIDMALQDKLLKILDYHHASALDFYYWGEDAVVVDVFFKHYVDLQ